MAIKKFLLGVGLLSGTIIGAGVFSLPYIFKSAGALTGFFYLILAAVVYITVLLMWAQVILKTSGDHRFVGYTRIYLGEKWSWLAVLITIVEMVLVLTIYLILSQSFGNLITPLGTGVQKMIIFWLLGSATIFLGLRRLAWLEFLITLGMTGIIFLIFILGGGKLPAVEWRWAADWKMFFLPLAPVLFSLSGRVAVPAIIEVGAPVKKSIIWGVALPVIVYGLFVLSVLALSPVVTQDAVTGLVGYIPSWAALAIGVFGILSLLSSYITVGFDVYKSLELDFKFPWWFPFLLVILGPLLIYLAGFNNFIGSVSFVGGIFLGLEGIFMIWMWLKATGRKISLPVVALLLVFMAALVYEIIK